jgi:F0F1-type ATP synthase delta subunit
VKFTEFLDEIQAAYKKDSELANLLVDPNFATGYVVFLLKNILENSIKIHSKSLKFHSQIQKQQNSLKIALKNITFYCMRCSTVSSCV